MDTNKLAQELKKCAPLPDTPREVFEAIRDLLPLVSVELFVRRGSSFVVIRKTGQFNGWALPSGFIGFNETIKRACQRIAKRDIGIPVVVHDIIGVFEWPEGSKRNGKGHAVSLLVGCALRKEVASDTFVEKSPHGMLAHHRIMANKALAKFR